MRPPPTVPVQSCSKSMCSGHCCGSQRERGGLGCQEAGTFCGDLLHCFPKHLDAHWPEEKSHSVSAECMCRATV